MNYIPAAPAALKATSGAHCLFSPAHSRFASPSVSTQLVQVAHIAKWLKLYPWKVLAPSHHAFLKLCAYLFISNWASVCQLDAPGVTWVTNHLPCPHHKTAVLPPPEITVNYPCKVINLLFAHWFLGMKSSTEVGSNLRLELNKTLSTSFSGSIPFLRTKTSVLLK